MWIEIEPFESKFEDVEIYFDSLQVKLFYDAVDDSNNRMSAHSCVYNFGISTHHYDKGSAVVGEVQIMLRNQGDDFNFCMFVLCNMRANSPIDKSGKSVFNKLIQFIFEWSDEYVKKNNIKDKSGNIFVVPHFKYSSEQYWNISD